MSDIANLSSIIIHNESKPAENELSNNKYLSKKS